MGNCIDDMRHDYKDGVCARCSAVDLRHATYEDNVLIINWLASVLATYGQRLEQVDRSMGRNGEGYFTDPKDAIRSARYNVAEDRLLKEIDNAILHGESNDIKPTGILNHHCPTKLNGE